MPDDACAAVYVCPQYSTALRPRTGDCCVFCSYGDDPRPPDQIRWESLINETAASGVLIQREVRLATKTRRRFIAEVSCAPLRVQGTGTPITHVLLTVRDATERRLAWEVQRRRQLELETLDRLTVALQQAYTAREAMGVILNEALTVLEIPAGAIWLWQCETSDLRLVAATDWLRAFTDVSIKPDEGIVGQTFSRGETLVVRELTPAAFERSAVVGRVPAKWGQRLRSDSHARRRRWRFSGSLSAGATPPA